ncbi:MAG: hypothetical protein DMG13_33130 [Acidobacteria bacterium]|nr:MAG: hypothetical protein DMG13_33130 [Acidobacteriota bacterium]
MKLEVQPGLPIQVTSFGSNISYPASGFVVFKNSQTGEHSHSGLRIFLGYADSPRLANFS